MFKKALLAIAPPLALLTASIALGQDTIGDPPANPPDDWPVPAKLDGDAKAAVAGINAFSLDLYRRTVEPGKNHFISPASVSVAMSLAYRAAGGTTADELRRVLHYTAPPADYLRATASVLDSMNFKRGGRELATANSIWIDKTVELRPDYLADTARLAGSAVKQADFRNAPDQSRETINQWVERKTNGKIRNLLHPENVKIDTRSVLVNAIYWKADWWSPFDAAMTKAEPFQGLDGRRSDWPLMHQKAEYRVLERNGVKAILLPYQGGELEMAVFLPNSPRGLPKFEARLTAERMDDWFSRLNASEPRETVLTLPKMHLEWRDDLLPTLKAMGMKEAVGLNADFSAIAVPKDAGVLAIGGVIHQTYLDVDEKGSEAAAATAVTEVVVTGLSRTKRPPPVIFRADHPFFFVLRDSRTGLTCFMGRFVGEGS